MSDKAQKEKPGSRVTHGAYSLIARGEFPSKRRYIERWLTLVRAGLIRDLGLCDMGKMDGMIERKWTE
ncbi:MAG: hypothetical protein IMZ50_06780, partial [Candidatus Atribacteria bacterium]|nr:hypothetical protein [Candidatus Atribacteria bacterium]